MMNNHTIDIFISVNEYTYLEIVMQSAGKSSFHI